jgi:hypothetical protein
VLTGCVFERSHPEVAGLLYIEQHAVVKLKDMDVDRIRQMRRKEFDTKETNIAVVI